jgi:hypothetical protein
MELVWQVTFVCRALFQCSGTPITLLKCFKRCYLSRMKIRDSENWLRDEIFTVITDKEYTRKCDKHDPLTAAPKLRMRIHRHVTHDTSSEIAEEKSDMKTHLYRIFIVCALVSYYRGAGFEFQSPNRLFLFKILPCIITASKKKKLSP